MCHLLRHHVRHVRLEDEILVMTHFRDVIENITTKFILTDLDDLFNIITKVNNKRERKISI